MAKNLRDLNEERDQRVTSERMILDGLNSDAQKIAGSVETEKIERQEMQGELVQTVHGELDRQRIKIQRIKDDAMAEFSKDRGGVSKEMDNRFEH